MSSRRLQVFLGVALVVLLFANLTLGRRHVGERNFEFLPTMVHSVPYDAYSAHPDLPNGMTMQSPPEGTVPRGRMPLGYGSFRDEALRAGAELTSPLPTNPQNQQEGAHLYGIYCQVCHGVEGLGNGTVAQRGFPAPPSFNSETSAALKEGQIFHIITFGQYTMPGHASQMSRAERWQVVQHVLTLRQALVGVGNEAAAQATQPKESVLSVSQATGAIVPSTENNDGEGDP